MAGAVAQHDLGLRVVARARHLMQVDAEWQMRTTRGFTWWAFELQQSVWSEPAVVHQGRQLWHVKAATDWARRPVNKAGRKLIDAAIQAADVSGLTIDTKRDVLRYTTSVYVHEDNVDWASDLFAWSTAMQVASAHKHVRALEANGLRPARSSHPRNGRRSQPDEMLGVLDPILEAGRTESRWATRPDVERALGILEAVSMLATGNGGITAEMPWGPNTRPAMLGGDSILLTVDPDASHALLGSGARCTIQLPEHPRVRGERVSALGLNSHELKSRAWSHFMGSWVHLRDAGVLGFVSFLPNALYKPGLLANMALSMAVRARWANRLHHRSTRS